MNFDQSGNITACCFNRSFILGRYPEQTLSEIWEGRPANELRQAMKKGDFNLGCQNCEKMIDDGNDESVLIKHFDEYYEFLAANRNEKNTLIEKFFQGWNSPKLPKPSVFEFEISNLCNLECIMCGGKWSSSIRGNREKLPALVNPYDAAFVEQIKFFLPSLKRANFLGGEPFLIPVYHDIWEAIISCNPAIEVGITSNGTVLNTRVKNIIERLPKLRISLSIDSLQKNTWEAIRVNGNFETLTNNLNYLLATGKLASFSVCPMVQNRLEIPEIVSYCEEHKLDIYFNIVNEPLGGRIEGIHEGGRGIPVNGSFKNALLPEVSLRYLPVDELEKLIVYYESFTFNGRWQIQMNALIRQLKTWKLAAPKNYAEQRNY
jgi:MoaA/NifB/PqqE/SkfB family radical SAM enzyme